MKTAYKFRLYPNRQQEAQLALTLETCRNLWNKALADRKNAWECEGITRSYEDQAALLVFEKQSNAYLNAVHSQVEQDVLRRLQKSFDNFFRRVREGARKKGYPRFKSINRYRYCQKFLAALEPLCIGLLWAGSKPVPSSEIRQMHGMSYLRQSLRIQPRVRPRP